jgi:hypothetical protein
MTENREPPSDLGTMKQEQRDIECLNYDALAEPLPSSVTREPRRHFEIMRSMLQQIDASPPQVARQRRNFIWRTDEPHMIESRDRVRWGAMSQLRSSRLREVVLLHLSTGPV